MELALINKQDKVEFSQELAKLLTRAAQLALDSHQLAADLELSVLLVDDGEIKLLNAQHRGIDEKTDVLSFPQYESLEELREELAVRDSSEQGPVLLGDIVISLERAKVQGEEYGHGLARELGYLLVHGLLHLLGYDHLEEKGQAQMRQVEEEILAQLSLTR